MEGTVLCECGTPQGAGNGSQSQEGPTGVSSGAALPNLLFCPGCQAVRCDKCVVGHIEARFCSFCLHNYSSGHENACSRTCFTCPICCSALGLSVKDDLDKNGLAGKRFLFKCHCCDFTYATEVVVRPRALASIVRSEGRRADSTETAFAELQKRYEKAGEGAREPLQKGHRSPNKDQRLSRNTTSVTNSFQNVSLSPLEQLSPSLSERRAQNLQLANLAPSKNPADPSDSFSSLDETHDRLKAASIALKSTLQDFPYNFHYNVHNSALDSAHFHDFRPEKPVQPLPVPARLSTRRSYKCGQCNLPLEVPTGDPVLTKFLTRWNALDLVPRVVVAAEVGQPYPKVLHPGHLARFVVNVTNPLEHDIKVSISTNSTIETTPATAFSAHTTLPLTDFTITGAKDTKNVVKTIPTSLLTQKTRLSRAEYIMRVGKAARVGPDDSLDMDGQAEHGPGWVLVPFSVSVPHAAEQSSTAVHLTVLFYLTVETRLPDTVRALGLSKKGLKYGFWAVVGLGPFSVEPARLP